MYARSQQSLDEVRDRYQFANQRAFDFGCTCEVYHAKERATGNDVAFKIVRREYHVVHGRWSRSYGKRPFDCPILDRGRFIDGRHWYVQPYGEELDDCQWVEVLFALDRTDIVAIDVGKHQWVSLPGENNRPVLVDYNCHITDDEFPPMFRSAARLFKIHMADCMGNADRMSRVRQSYLDAWRKKFHYAPIFEVWLERYLNPVDKLCSSNRWGDTESLGRCV